ncbi:hypothetical protein QYF36_025211 [Acer negundo]|nr:hypothetical protein QYF36_025211 [Acer negundo]
MYEELNFIIKMNETFGRKNLFASNIYDMKALPPEEVATLVEIWSPLITFFIVVTGPRGSKADSASSDVPKGFFALLFLARRIFGIHHLNYPAANVLSSLVFLDGVGLRNGNKQLSLPKLSRKLTRTFTDEDMKYSIMNQHIPYSVNAGGSTVPARSTVNLIGPLLSYRQAMGFHLPIRVARKGASVKLKRKKPLIEDTTRELLRLFMGLKFILEASVMSSPTRQACIGVMSSKYG